MLLAYIDESGINYRQSKNNYFNIDGPYAIWSCVLINEMKYFSLERGFQDLAKKYLGKYIKTQELHATKIWDGRKTVGQDKKVRRYFEELIQFTGKLHIPVLFGIQQKNPNFRKKTKKNRREKTRELQKARYSLLSLLEYQLGEINETAILVSDLESKKEELKNLVFERTKWRYNPPKKKAFGLIRPKFVFEYQSNSILDQLHYVDSKESILMQFADHISFVLRKTFEHLYLLNFPKNDGSRPIADRNRLPVTEDTFNAFVTFCGVKSAFYDEKNKDVNMGFLSASPRLFFTFGNSPNKRIQVIGQPYRTDVANAMSPFTPYG